MKRREPRDLAALLLAKADQDAAAVRALLGEPSVSDEIIAFHAQQAVEKALKAVLALHGVRYGRTHNLGALIDLAGDAGETVPEWMREAEELTPFAIAFRYEDAPADLEPFDREQAYELVRRARSWSAERVQRA